MLRDERHWDCIRMTLLTIATAALVRKPGGRG